MTPTTATRRDSETSQVVHGAYPIQPPKGRLLNSNTMSHYSEKDEMSSTEVADLLAVDRRSVSRFAAEGKLSSYKKHNKLYFKKEEVEAFAQKRGVKILAAQTYVPAPEEKPASIGPIAEDISKIEEEINALKTKINILRRNLLENQQLLSEKEKFLGSLQSLEKALKTQN